MAQAPPPLRGSGGVFGGAINPLAVYMQQGAQRQARQAKAYEEETKRRDELIADMRKFDPNKAWEPQYGEVNQFAQEHVKDWFFDQLRQGKTVTQINPELERRKGETNTLMAKSQWHKNQFESIGKAIDEDKNLDPKYYHNKLNNLYFDGMVARPINSVNTDGYEKMFDDSKGYDQPKIISDFMKTLPEKINQHYTVLFTPYGKTYNIQELGTKLGNQYDEKGNIILDPRTLLPKISVTDDVYVQAMNNKYLRNMVNDNVGLNSTIEQKREYLKTILEGQDPKKIKNNPQLGDRIPEGQRRFQYFGGYGYQTPKADLEQRDALLNRIVTGTGHDTLNYFSEATKDVKASYVKKDGKRYVDITYPSYISGFVPKPSDEVEKMSDADKIAYYAAREASKTIKHTQLPINTEDERRAAKVALSQRMDEIDKKRSIGEEYATYIEEKRKKGTKAAPADNL